MALGNHAVVIREFAFDELGDKFLSVERKSGLVAGKLHVNITVFITQQTQQLEHSFTRQYHFLLGNFGFQRRRCIGQTVTVSRYQAKLFAFGNKQNTIQVVTDIVHSH